MEKSPYNSIEQVKNSVLFVGSGLSADIETSLPAGGSMSNALIARIMESCGLPIEGINLSSMLKNSFIFNNAKKTPFEVIFDGYPEPDKLRNILSNLYADGRPSRFHRFIAQLIKRGNVSDIVTTNYDCCIEQGCDLEAVDNLEKVVKEDDEINFKKIDRDRRLFKIHGCCHQEREMIFTLAAEGTMPQWKVDLLVEIVRERDVFVIGYSGLDFDICPFLLKMPFRGLHWLFPGAFDFKDQIQYCSPVLRYVHKRPADFPNIFAIEGGFDAFFSVEKNRLSKFQFTSQMKKINKAIEEILNHKSEDNWKYILWQGHLLGAFSCKYGMYGAARRLEKISSADQKRPQVNRFLSDIDEAEGKYLRSLSSIWRARKSYEHDGNIEGWLETYIVEVSRFAAGRFAFKLRTARRKFESKVICIASQQLVDLEPYKHRVLFLRVLEVRAWQRITMRLFSPQVSIELRDVQAALRYYLDKGALGDYLLLRSYSNDIGLEIVENERMRFNLDVVGGFSHLNTVVARTAAYRRAGNTDEESCDDLLIDLIALGHSVEMWKFFLTFMHEISSDNVARYTHLARASLVQCEMFQPLKIVYRIAFEWHCFKRRLIIGKRVSHVSDLEER